MASRLTPASSGVQGPGETTRWVRPCSRMPSTVISSLRNTWILRARDLPQVLHQVVGERVVVVYHQDAQVAQTRRREASGCSEALKLCFS